MAAFVATVLVPMALAALTPPLQDDEVRYHLPYAMHFVEQERIVPNLFLRFPFFTLNVNLLYAAAFLFGDDVTPHYVHLLLGALAGLALYVLASPVCGRAVAFASVMLFFAVPHFAKFASTAFIDMGLAAFVTSAVACLDRARDRPALVVCAGLAFGAALGSKYLVLAFAPLLVAWAAYRTRSGPLVARFAVIALLTGAPWYVYNAVWTGNPISPFAAEWFGSWPWTAEDTARQIDRLTEERLERSWAGLLSLPWYLVTDSRRFNAPPIPALLAIGLAALALLPWWSRGMRPYGVLVLVVVVVWFFTTPYFRYLAAVQPLLCLISVWSLAGALRLVVSVAARVRAVPEAAGRSVAVWGAVVLAVIVAEIYFWGRYRPLGYEAVTERVVHRERFLRETLPVYGVVEHLRRSGARNEVILAFQSRDLFSYVRMNRVVGDYFGPMAFRRTLFKYSPCDPRFPEPLRRAGISLLVVPRRLADPTIQTETWPTLARRECLASSLTSEYTDRHSIVFRVGPPAPPSESSHE